MYTIERERVTLNDVITDFNVTSVRVMSLQKPLDTIKRYLKQEDIKITYLQILFDKFNGVNEIKRYDIVIEFAKYLKSLIGDTHLWRINAPHTAQNITTRLFDELEIVDTLIQVLRSKVRPELIIVNTYDTTQEKIELTPEEQEERDAKRIAHQQEKEREEQAAKLKLETEVREHMRQYRKEKALAEARKHDQLDKQNAPVIRERIKEPVITNQAPTHDGGYTDPFAALSETDNSIQDFNYDSFADSISGDSMGTDVSDVEYLRNLKF